MITTKRAAVLFLTALAAAGCAGTRGDDAASDSADDEAALSSTKLPAKVTASEEKNWVVADDFEADDGDVVALRLYSDGTYVRRRCYGAGCAQAVPETDRFTAFSSKGKTYVQFHSFTRTLVPAQPAPPGGKARGDEWVDHDVVADTYELRTSAGALKLRKTYSARWVKLGLVDDATLCQSSGGAMEEVPPPPPPVVKVPPTTKGQQPAASPAPGATPAPTTSPGFTFVCRCAAADQGFIPGAGGCMHLTISSESACDDTHGAYTDDDATRIGTFCQCGLGRTMTETGCADL